MTSKYERGLIELIEIFSVFQSFFVLLHHYLKNGIYGR